LTPKFLVVPAAVVAGLLLPSTALAQSGGNWRRQRDSGTLDYRHLFAEVRFGGYYPRVDEEFGGAATPYANVFCRTTEGPLNCLPQFVFGVELDWLPLRIPYVGSIGPGVSWHFTTMRAPAKLAADGSDSGINTFLNIMPLGAIGVLRFDELFRRTGFPLVPVVKGGFATAYWWTGTDTGDSSTAVPGGDPVPGNGWSFGWQLSLGGAIALDWIDRESMARLAGSTGFRHLYVTGEWWLVDVGSLGGKQMRVGSSGFTLGLGMEM